MTAVRRAVGTAAATGLLFLFVLAFTAFDEHGDRSDLTWAQACVQAAAIVAGTYVLCAVLVALALLIAWGFAGPKDPK